MNGAGNGKFAAPSTSVLPSKTIVAVAVAERCLRVESGPLTVGLIGPIPVQEESMHRLLSMTLITQGLPNRFT